jgi:muramoyltetrapeptide carboxypeptidase
MSKTLLNIEVIAPCSPFDPHRLQRGIDALKARGHQVQAPSLPTDWAHGYLNGDAACRANAIINGLKNPNNDVVWIARGGYGLTPLLPELKKHLKHLNTIPKLIGFSDVTALHCFLLSQCDHISFHGPLATTLADESPEDIDAVLDWMSEQTTEASYINLTPCADSHSSESISGRFWGGNLTVLGHLAGTGFLPKMPGILFLEDVGERPYRIDRILHQLEQSQAFANIQAVVLGHFSHCEEPETGQKRMGPVPTTKEVLQAHFVRLKIPVYEGLPCGHQAPNHAFPVGGEATIQQSNDRATLYLTTEVTEVS